MASALRMTVGSRIPRQLATLILRCPSQSHIGLQRSFLSTSAVLSSRLRTPPNLILNFVPQQQAWIVERFGKYLRILQPGLNILIPIIDNIKYIQSLKENAMDIPSQSAITEDNVTLHLDGVLYYKVVDPYKASYGVEDAQFAVVQLAQTTMRSELGKIKLDSVFQERMNLNSSIVEAINHASEAWGILCMRYEIKDIQLPTKVKEAMQMQVEAERKKRANILESEGMRYSAINRAEGLRQSKILASEAMRIEQVNKAKGEAAAILARAQARAQALNTVGRAIGQKHGSKAASLVVAEQYIQAFSKLAKTSNTLLLPEKTGDISSMVSQAMAIFGHMSTNSRPAGTPTDPDDDESLSAATSSSELADVSSDLEKALEELDSGIKASVGDIGEIARQQEKTGGEEPPHFTIAPFPSQMAFPFVAVHAGAGYHSDSNSKELKIICRNACNQAMKLLKEGKSCNEATAVAVSTLEDSALTNAGLGSNLTLTGIVECDASIMDGYGGFGAVGALQGVSNPIKVAQKLLEQSSEGSLSLGRVPPIILVGEGAWLWAKQHEIQTCTPDKLITDRARAVYLDHKSRLDEVTQSLGTKRRKRDWEMNSQQRERLDTVGAICVDCKGNISAGVSSGGISLKFPGRLGQASMFGCGCWAENRPTDSSNAIACSTSGTGEYIIKTMLARECAVATIDSTLHTALNDRFLCSKSLENIDQKLAGVIAVNSHPEGGIHFSWGHTTESMCIGYMSARQKESTALISKIGCIERVGMMAQIEGLKL